MRYNNYHKHTYYSSIYTPDSHTSVEDYCKRAVELQHTSYFTTEHGFGGDIFECSEICSKYNLNCIFAVEGYIVPNPLEKDKSNYHIMIIPTNDEARKNLNEITSRANEEGYYYKPRIFLEDLLKCDKKDFYITTACIAGIIRDEIGLEKIFLPLVEHFGKNIFLEVQDHNDKKQKEMNKKAIELSKKYNLNLIHANDSHYIYQNDKEDRENLLKGKKIFYEDEGNFILDYPDYDTIVRRYKDQNILNNSQIVEALKSTLIFDNIENIKINKNIKIPNINKKLTPKERLQKLKSTINDNYKKIKIQDKISKEENSLYIKAIREEFKVLEDTMKLNTMDYFLLNYPLIHLAIEKYEGVLTTTSRGSAGSYYINRLLGITQLDRIRAKIPLYYERFMSTARLIENNSMPDCDFNVANPEPFRKASRELLGEDGCHWMIAYGTMQEAEAFRNTCRAKNIPYDDFNSVAKNLDKYRNDEKWEPLIKECQKFVDVIVSASPHPCSCLLFDGNLKRELGILKIGDFICCPITSGEADHWNYLKNDYLTVSTVDITQKIFNLIGIPRMSLIELEDNLDDKTWEIYAKGFTCVINQIDSSYATNYAMKYKPKNVSELAMLTGVIRPNFADYRDDFISRKKYKNSVTKMDKIFSSTNGFIIFQENLMQFFQWLGISPAKSIGLIKKISKKKIKQEDFDNLTETLKTNWIKENGSIIGFEETWVKIQSMMAYGYNSPHALAMAYDSLYGAYLKSHYPLEFYTVVLNDYKGDEERTNKLTDELYYFGISLNKPKFRYSKAEYFMDKETNIIYKGTSSIKYLNETSAEYLYSLRDKIYDSFTDLLVEIENAKTEDNKSPINSRQMEILIQLQYFEEFGHNAKLLSIYRLFKALYGRKTISKDKLSSLGLTVEQVSKNAQKETEKQYSELNTLNIIKEIEQNTKNESIPIKEQCKIELEILGYISCTYPEFSKQECLVLDVDTKFTPRINLYCLKNGKNITCKINKATFKNKPLKKGDIVKCLKFNKKPKWKKTDDGFEKTGETEWELSVYEKEEA